MNEFGIIPLSTENIISFASYIPKEELYRITRENWFGFGAVTEDEKTCGLILAEERSGDEGALVEYLFVDETLRRQGIGRSLLTEMKNECTRRGLSACAVMYHEEDLEAEEFLASYPEAVLLRPEKERTYLAMIPLSAGVKQNLLSPEEKFLASHPLAEEVEPYLTDLADELTERGVQCDLISAFGEVPFLDCLTKEGYRVRAVFLPEEGKDTFRLHLLSEHHLPARGRKAALRLLQEWQKDHEKITAYLEPGTGELTMESSMEIPGEGKLTNAKEALGFFQDFVKEADSCDGVDMKPLPFNREARLRERSYLMKWDRTEDWAVRYEYALFNAVQRDLGKEALALYHGGKAEEKEPTGFEFVIQPGSANGNNPQAEALAGLLSYRDSLREEVKGLPEKPDLSGQYKKTLLSAVEEALSTWFTANRLSEEEGAEVTKEEQKEALSHLSKPMEVYQYLVLNREELLSGELEKPRELSDEEKKICGKLSPEEPIFTQIRILDPRFSEIPAETEEDNVVLLWEESHSEEDDGERALKDACEEELDLVFPEEVGFKDVILLHAGREWELSRFGSADVKEWLDDLSVMAYGRDYFEEMPVDAGRIRQAFEKERETWRARKKELLEILEENPLLSESLSPVSMFSIIPEAALLRGGARAFRDTMSLLVNGALPEHLEEAERQELRELYVFASALYDTLDVKLMYIAEAGRYGMRELMEDVNLDTTSFAFFLEEAEALR